MLKILPPFMMVLPGMISKKLYGDEFKNNREAFNSNASSWTLIYANKV